MSIKGKKLECHECEETGIKEVSNRELQQEIANLKHDIRLLREALLKDLGFQGTRIPKKVQEANHAQ